MSIYLSNRDGNGKTNEEGHYRLQTRLYTGFALEADDLKVLETSPLSLGIRVSPGDYRLETAAGYSYTGWIDADTTVTITTADASNPRITLIVLYVDKGATTSASPPNNPGIAKLMAVNGTAASSPTAPSGAAVQSAVGSGNPYYVIASVRVGTASTQITNADITDLRELIKLNQSLYIEEVYPVGSIYMNATESANPSTYLGFGTWSAFGQGRVPVGKASTGTFGTAGATGGEETHILTSAENGAHTHSIDPPTASTNTTGNHSHTYSAWRQGSYPGGDILSGGFLYGNPPISTGTTSTAGNHSHTVNIPSFTSGNSGSGSPHNNLQPFVVVYMWVRTA